MSCTNAPSALEAYADGDLDAELDVAVIASIATHLVTCADCRAEVASIKQLNASLQRELPRYPASDVLRARMKSLVMQSAAGERPPVSATPGVEAASIAASTTTSIAISAAETARSVKSLRNWKVFALAASVLFAIVSAHDFVSRKTGRTASRDIASLESQELINAHIRSLMSDHLVDVPSSDRHTVKPWFEGKISFSPAVFDFAADSFPLAGGRLDYTTGHPLAAIVFHSGQHAINLFVWPVDSADDDIASVSRDGYNIASWRRNHLQYSAVSTLNAGSLARFASLYVARDSVTGAVQR